MIYRVHQDNSYCHVTFDYSDPHAAISFMHGLIRADVKDKEDEYSVWLEFVAEEKEAENGEEESV